MTAITGGRITLRNDMLIVSVWHSLGHHVFADVAPRCANAAQELLLKQMIVREKAGNPDAPR